MQRAYLLRERQFGEPVGNRGSEQVSVESDQQDAIAVRPGQSIAEMEKTLILATLEGCRGNKNEAAKSLGICVKTLYNRLHEYEYVENSCTWQFSNPT